ncbi:PAS domain-containing sensor histidine kinase [Neiella marina]|uniref:Phosphate regulon sensor protein PhoR n=1 Tax=Neiella marina TaxID=508461 RepID=A0A8J2XMQ0_9GAMM|nr:phosphate regulon sensor histidine kinase PhoR [Neiella marina]GGA65961.1 PAS domain-containing sensor histidine kinase [Neiella marina]
MRERSIGWGTLTTVILMLAVAGIFGLLFDAPLLFAGVCALALLFWHYRHMKQLSVYLWRDKRFAPPAGSGSWGVIYDGLYRLQQRNRRRRKDLARLLKRFRRGAEALPDGAVVIQKDRSIVWSNQLAQRLLGLRWPEDAGQRIDNLIRNPEFIEYINATDGPDLMVFPSPAEPMRMIEFRRMPYDKKQILLVVRDVTQWLRLEQMRRDFVANVSHELRTPLTVVQGYIEMLQDPQSMPPEMWQKAQSMMLEQTHRMDSLVSQLLTLSKIEANDRPDTSHEIDVPGLLSTIAEEAKTLAEERNLSIQLFVESGLMMKGDLMQMRSAFSNLIFNAVHYTPDGGHIKIHWQRCATGAEFAVRDDGDGIAAEHLARLTERFYRVDRARSRKTGGSGLGLAIVKHALSHHQSSLNIESELTFGSTFSFIIPTSLIYIK